ncbi:hypothetical protein KY342_03340 [Candidatus Woesearchaeota archaeon]|nr:hypothetical protein [Candidatus Woesearchaeota archaeon]
MKIKEEYNKLKEKYNLPEFSDVDNEFEISIIEHEEFLLREIRRKITEKMEDYIKVLERILQPETVLSEMYECKIFTDEEKDVFFKLFRRLMFFDRLSVETSIDENDKKSAEFINDFWKDWGNIKKELSDFIKKLKEGWLKETKIKEELGYLG